jgi:hypothetical protein
MAYVMYGGPSHEEILINFYFPSASARSVCTYVFVEKHVRLYSELSNVIVKIHTSFSVTTVTDSLFPILFLHTFSISAIASFKKLIPVRVGTTL